ncbi:MULTISPECIES: hypothetical protein [Acinetobacter]|jgi:hypothetical protein|uniref:Uncharacterized protein n=1 Tax=Acinetobacter entericus TaxID=2989714 RepID=A0ABT3NLS7_9GAMM|nr:MULTISPECIES: hypothetical protein [Acinetobacter]MCW8040506.1 hypothetical protein [Acinetobacter entericus]
MLKLLFVFVGVFCIWVWPWVYLLRYRISETQALKQYAMLFGPALVLLASILSILSSQLKSAPKLAVWCKAIKYL